MELSNCKDRKKVVLEPHTTRADAPLSCAEDKMDIMASIIIHLALVFYYMVPPIPTSEFQLEVRSTASG